MAENPQPKPPPASSDTALIIGGGVIGLACAYYLQQEGLHVTVVDQGTIAGACSAENCGYVCPSHVLPLTEPGMVSLALKSLFTPNAPFRVKPLAALAPRHLAWMLRFAARCNHKTMLAGGHALKTILDASMTLYKELLARETIDCEWRELGLLYVNQTPRGLDTFAETNALLTQEYGVSARRIEGPDLPALDPALRDDLAGAYLYEDDCSLRPDRFNQGLRHLLESRDATLLEHTEVTALVRHPTDRRRIAAVQTSNPNHADIPADHIVLATGAWAGDRRSGSPNWSKQLHCNLPIQPGKGYSITMQRPGIFPTYPMLFPEHRVGVTPMRDGYRLGSMMEFAGFDASIPEKRLDVLRIGARPYLREPTTDVIQSTWFGWRPMTYDSLPIIDRAPGLDNTLLAVGHNMLGLTLAPITGRLIADLLREKEPMVPVNPFAVTRF